MTTDKKYAMCLETYGALQAAKIYEVTDHAHFDDMYEVTGADGGWLKTRFKEVSFHTPPAPPPPPAERPVQTGDVVRLKSGGPNMTAVRWAQDLVWVCYWFRDGEVFSYGFTVESLVRVAP